MLTQEFQPDGRSGSVRIERDAAGLAHISADHLADALWGLGYAHARDRGLQMLLVRILGRGQASELLAADEPSLDLDRFFRGLNFGADFRAESAALAPRARELAVAYCGGVNRYFGKKGVPWELRALGYSMASDPWTVADLFLVAKLLGYVGLAQSQAEVERFLVECVRRGLSRERLEELFPGQLGGLDEALLRQARVPQPYLPEWMRGASALPSFLASNNWALAPHKSATGHALFANDPHLEINRLPPVWYPAVLRWQDGQPWRYAMGGTVPGVPAVVVGRTPELAWGVTFAMADCVDSWIEECRDGRFRRRGEWIPFRARKETIRRKGKPPLEITFHENEHGLLAGEPREAGLYLATRWSCGQGTSASSLEAALALLSAKSVEQGRRVLGRLNNSSWNWVLADRDGNIGYQMSGQMPLRREGVSGLVPLPGWEPGNDWRGFAAPEDLPRALNPSAGYLCTANDDLNHLGRVRPLNVPMAGYRAERIAAELGRSGLFTLEQMQRLQLDLCSTQAMRFLALLKPLLETRAAAGDAHARLLRDWDARYDLASPGASVFERFYRLLIEEVFGGEDGLGRDGIRYLLDETALFIGYFGNFDRVMLAERSAWFGPRTREQIYAAALDQTLRAPAGDCGRTRPVAMKHLLLGGKLPRWMGLDRGPIALAGSRATVSQGQIFRSARRESTFGPSLRVVTDLGGDELHLAMPGGASDRCWSRWYNNLTAEWLAGRYRVLRGK